MIKINIFAYAVAILALIVVPAYASSVKPEIGNVEQNDPRGVSTATIMPKQFSAIELGLDSQRSKEHILDDLAGITNADRSRTVHPQQIKIHTSQQNGSDQNSGMPLDHQPDAPGIYGHVTLSGANISGVSLSLRYWNGTTWTTRATTTTGADGIYVFSSVPSLLPGEEYYVNYSNVTISNRLNAWYTASIYEYTSGDNVNIGDFDIADVPLTDPSDGETVSLPEPFNWTKRSATPTDKYEILLFNPAGSEYWFMGVGNAGSHTLDCLPPGFSARTTYGWIMGVYSPDGGYGNTFYQEVKFSNNPSCSGIQGKVTKNGVNAAGVYLELRFLDVSESDYLTRSDIVTAADGTFKLTSVPSLTAGQLYYVRYMNTADTVGNLWFWGTDNISAYTKNTAVSIGDFDVADISLVAPLHNTSQALPVSFSWTPRAATPADQYYFNIEVNETEYHWWQFHRGYSGAFTMSCLFPGMENDAQYNWWISINKQEAYNGSYGISYYSRFVTMTGGSDCSSTYIPSVVR